MLTKKATKNIDGVEELELEEYFEHEVKLLACCHENKNFFSSVDTKELLHEFKKVGGVSNYIGREGIEFYPQELMVFKLSDLKGTDNCTCLRNIQNKKSKYKVPEFDVLLETEFLHPMIKGKDITPFHVECGEYIVPFPYEKENPRVPISMKNLSKKAPRLANYYIENKFSFKKGVYHEDFGLIPYVIYKARKVKSIDFIGYYYIQRNGSIMNNNDYKKTVKKAFDMLEQYKTMRLFAKNINRKNNLDDYFLSYISNSVIVKARELKKDEKKVYINELKKLNVFDGVLVNTRIRRFKKYFMKYNLNLYLKVVR